MAAASETLELLECPLCFETIYPPIHQCPNGHIICSTCKSKVNNKCPSCRFDFGEIRCLILEKLLATMSLSCQYQNKGCQELVPYDSKVEHEDSCRFRPYNCPYSYPPCDVKGGDIPSLLAHMRNVHHSTLLNVHTIDTLFSICSSDDKTIYEFMGDHFCLQLQELPHINLVSLVLRFMGEEVEARRYRYSLEIGDHDRTMRRMIWFGVPKSIRETMEKIMESGDLMIIHDLFVWKLAQQQEEENGELGLRVKGLIWKEEDAPTVQERPFVFSNGYDHRGPPPPTRLFFAPP